MTSSVYFYPILTLATPTFNFQPTKLLDPGYWYKVTFMMRNCADQIRSQLIWIYTVWIGREYPGSAGPGLTLPISWQIQQMNDIFSYSLPTTKKQKKKQQNNNKKNPLIFHARCRLRRNRKIRKFNMLSAKNFTQHVIEIKKHWVPVKKLGSDVIKEIKCKVNIG